MKKPALRVALACALCSLVLWAPFTRAVEDESPLGMTIPDNAYNQVEAIKKAPQSPRVRIPVEMVPFEKVIYRDAKGIHRAKFRPSGIMRHHLRARVERPNHFYVGSWHIESTPVKWEKATGQYEVRLSFYKRYGEGKGLEEFIGHVDAKGLLEGKEPLLSFHGYSQQLLRNRDQEDVLELIIGNEQDKSLSQRKEKTPVLPRPVAKKGLIKGTHSN